MLSKKDRDLLHKFIHRLAYCAERASNRTCSSFGSDRNVDGLRDIIARQEKGHRRFAPAGWRHVSSVSQACDYFVCATLAEGRDAGTKPFAQFEGVRDDYLRGAFLMCKPAFVEALDGFIAEEFGKFTEKTPAELLRLVKEADYSAVISGSRERHMNGEDEGTTALLAEVKKIYRHDGFQLRLARRMA